MLPGALLILDGVILPGSPRTDAGQRCIATSNSHPCPCASQVLDFSWKEHGSLQCLAPPPQQGRIRAEAERDGERYASETVRQEQDVQAEFVEILLEKEDEGETRAQTSRRL